MLKLIWSWIKPVGISSAACNLRSSFTRSRLSSFVFVHELFVVILINFVYQNEILLIQNPEHGAVAQNSASLTNFLISIIFFSSIVLLFQHSLILKYLNFLSRMETHKSVPRKTSCNLATGKPYGGLANTVFAVI